MSFVIQQSMEAVSGIADLTFKLLDKVKNSQNPLHVQLNQQTLNILMNSVATMAEKRIQIEVFN